MSKKVNSNHHIAGDTGYSLGLFCGLLIGSLGTYILLSPNGKKLKEIISNEFDMQKQAWTLEQVGVTEPQLKPSLTNTLAEIRALLTRVKKKLGKEVQAETKKEAHHGSVPVKKKHYFKAKN